VTQGHQRALGRITPENIRYLTAKRDRAGHALDLDAFACRSANVTQGHRGQILTPLLVGAAIPMLTPRCTRRRRGRHRRPRRTIDTGDRAMKGDAKVVEYLNRGLRSVGRRSDPDAHASLHAKASRSRAWPARSRLAVR
jgi:hypothetical protein